jgi:hypothetical protein
LSVSEDEDIAAATFACQGVWLAWLLADIFQTKPTKPVLRVDKKSAISLIKNLVHHYKSKHIDTRFLIQDYTHDGQTEVKFIWTD